MRFTLQSANIGNINTFSTFNRTSVMLDMGGVIPNTYQPDTVFNTHTSQQIGMLRMNVLTATNPVTNSYVGFTGAIAGTTLTITQPTTAPAVILPIGTFIYYIANGGTVMSSIDITGISATANTYTINASTATTAVPMYAIISTPITTLSVAQVYCNEYDNPPTYFKHISGRTGKLRIYLFNSGASSLITGSLGNYTIVLNFNKISPNKTLKDVNYPKSQLSNSIW